MAKVTMKPARYVNKVVSKAAAPAVRKKAEEIAAKAEARLGAHKDTGASHIEVKHGNVDSIVSLVDPAALSIEFGHTAANGREVEGIYALWRSAGLM